MIDLTFDDDNNKTQLKKSEKIRLESLRERHRNEQLTFRESQREFLLEKARFLQEQRIENFIDHDITSLAQALKNKGRLTCDLLKATMNALLESKENITAFLKVDGALQALLRLLSGQNEKFQLLSAQCICNLALGDERERLQVLKASESYLLMHLTGRNSYVMEACTIALGNFSMHSLKNITLLMNQNFFSKIINLLSSGHPNIEAGALYALTQIIYYGFDLLRLEDIKNCLSAILPIFISRSVSVAFLISILTSYNCTHAHFITNQIHVEALKHLFASLKEKEKEVVYFLRIVSNLINEPSGVVAKDLIEKETYIFKDCVMSLLGSEKKYLKKECLGLIGNLLNHPVGAFSSFGMELVKENFELIKQYKDFQAKGIS